MVVSQHVCKVCKREFPRGAALASHMRTHLKHECPECHEKFVTPMLLGKHRYFAHGVKGTSAEAIKRRAEKNGQPVPAAETQVPLETVAIKRRYKKRPKVGMVTNEFPIHYCPGCGTNIHNLAAAMTAIKDMK